MHAEAEFQQRRAQEAADRAIAQVFEQQQQQQRQADLQQLFHRAQPPALAGYRAHHDTGDFDNLHQADLYNGYAVQAGLQGLIDTAPSRYRTAAAPVKKFTQKSSHPRKLAPGYSADIIPPFEQDDAHANKAFLKKNYPAFDTANLASKKIRLVPTCASCFDPLFLECEGERRLWALRCGHVVCGKCIGAAQMRCEAIKEAERKGRWKQGVHPSKEVIDLANDDDDDDDELEYLDVTVIAPTKPAPSRRSTRANPLPSTEQSFSLLPPGKSYSKSPRVKTPLPAKNKGKAKAKVNIGEADEVDREWTSCPVFACTGPKTDLLLKNPPAADGEFERDMDTTGAFELFV